MKPKICVSISPRSASQLAINLRKAAESSADLIEVRLDSMAKDLQSQDFRPLTKFEVPLIATNRNHPDRDTPITEKERRDLLFRAVDAGFHYVDLELDTPDLESVTEKFRETQARIILSTHDYSKTPAAGELNSTLHQMRSFKPDICKLITTARNHSDNLTVLNVLEENHRTVPLVCFAMGRQGIFSRILAPFHGAPFTYASLEPGGETAPGQPTISQLRQIYGIIGSG